MNLWNQKCLPAPPTNTYKSKSRDLDLIKLRNALTEGINHFKNEDFMIRETAILSRILYRMKMKFRNWKDFKALEKINHSLNIYLTSNVSSHLKNIITLIPTKYFTDTYLPTRNMLYYILVRIQGLVKLMERLYDSCQIAAAEVHKRILLGHFWKVYLVLFSLVSRISILVKFNTKFLCELYGKLLPHTKKLENPFRNWLPEGYELPSDLREWLGVQWVYEEDYIDLTFEPTQKILDFFDLVDDDDDDVQFCDEYVLIDEEDKNIADEFKKLKPVKETFTRNRMRGFSINEDDIGEDIAEIIKLNDTIAENTTSEDLMNEEEIKLYSSNILDVNEDIGQELYDQEHISQDRPETLNLDSNNTNHNRPNEIKEYSKVSVNNNDLAELSKNKKDTIRHDLVPTMVSEVIVIPETPLKKSHNHLKYFNNLNDSRAENTENQNKKKSCPNIKNKNIDVEDIGEEISHQEDNSEEILETIMLDSSDKGHTTGIKIKEHNKNNNNFSKKNVPRKKKDRNKFKTINLVDDTTVSEVIVIPETPVKKSHNFLRDDSVIVVENITESKKINNSLLDSSKKIKRKKDQKLLKKALKNSARKRIDSIINSSVHSIKEEKEKSALVLDKQKKALDTNVSVNLNTTPSKQKQKSLGDSSVIALDNSSIITPKKRGQKRKRVEKALKNFDNSIISSDNITDQIRNHKNIYSFNNDWTGSSNKIEIISRGKATEQTNNRLIDTNEIELGHTLVNTSGFSKTLNDSILNSSRNVKKKKKKNLKTKEVLENSAILHNKLKVKSNVKDKNLSSDDLTSSVSKNKQKQKSKLKTPLKDSEKINRNSKISAYSVIKQNTKNISSDINSPLSERRQKREKRKMKQALKNSSMICSVLDQDNKNISLNISNTPKGRLKKDKKFKKGKKKNS